MTQQARVRRLQDTLGIVGVGVIAFGAWTLAKTTMFFFLYDEGSLRQLYGIDGDISMRAFFISFVVIAVFDMMVRMYVGLSARAEGRGKRKGSVYLAIAAIMAAMSVASLVLIAFGISGSPSVFDVIMTAIIETTSIVTLVLMIFCAVRLRRLSRQAG